MLDQVCLYPICYGCCQSNVRAYSQDISMTRRWYCFASLSPACAMDNASLSSQSLLSSLSPSVPLPLSCPGIGRRQTAFLPFTAQALRLVINSRYGHRTALSNNGLPDTRRYSRERKTGSTDYILADFNNGKPAPPDVNGTSLQGIET